MDVRAAPGRPAGLINRPAALCPAHNADQARFAGLLATADAGPHWLTPLVRAHPFRWA